MKPNLWQQQDLKKISKLFKYIRTEMAENMNRYRSRSSTQIPNVSSLRRGYPKVFVGEEFSHYCAVPASSISSWRFQILPGQLPETKWLQMMIMEVKTKMFPRAYELIVKFWGFWKSHYMVYGIELSSNISKPSSKQRRNKKTLPLCLRPPATEQYWLADSVKVAHPLKLQHLHHYTSRILPRADETSVSRFPINGQW